MDGWMTNGWLDRKRDGWMDGWIKRQKREIYGWMDDERMDGQKERDIWMDGKAGRDRRTQRLINE